MKNWKQPLIVWSMITSLSLTLGLMFSACTQTPPNPEQSADNASVQEQLEDLKQQLVALKTENDGLTLDGGENTEVASSPPEPAEDTTVSSSKLKSVKFSDLNDEVPHVNKITDLARLGVLSKTSGAFKPYKPISRAEFTRWLYKSYNALAQNSTHQRATILMAPQSKPFFSDLNASHRDYKYVQALSNSGYSVGYEDGTFKPDQAITREEMMGIKVALDNGGNVKPARSMMQYVWKFSDGKSVDDRFTGYIYRDYHIGHNMNRAFGEIKTLKPKSPLMRYEAAAILWKFHNLQDAKRVVQNIHDQG